MLFSKSNLRFVMATMAAVVAILAIEPNKAEAQQNTSRGYWVSGQMTDVELAEESVRQHQRDYDNYMASSQRSLNKPADRALDELGYKRRLAAAQASYQQALRRAGKLSVLGAAGVGAAALTGYTDVQASAVRGVTVDGTGAPKPLTVKGSNIGAASSVGAILGTQSAQPGAAERAAAKTAK